MNRRDFLKTTGGAMLALALPQLTVDNSTVEAVKNKIIIPGPAKIWGVKIANPHIDILVNFAMVRKNGNLLLRLVCHHDITAWDMPLWGGSVLIEDGDSIELSVDGPASIGIKVDDMYALYDVGI